MAVRYRKISITIWNDIDFRGFSDAAKLLYFVLSTHPHTTSLGALRANVPGLACELSWTVEAFREALSEALGKGWAKYDERASLIWLPAFLTHNAPESPNVIRSWVGGFAELPECPLKDEISQAVKGYVEGLSEGFQKAFEEAWPHPSPNQKQKKKEEKEEENPLTVGTTVNEDRAGAREVPGEEEALRAAREVKDRGGIGHPSASDIRPLTTATMRAETAARAPSAFGVLRAWWDAHARHEAPGIGFGEWWALRGTSGYPGDAELLAAAQATVAAHRWRHGFAPGLARFLTEGMWRVEAQAPAKPLQRPSEAPSMTPGDMQSAAPTTTTAPASVRGRA